MSYPCQCYAVVIPGLESLAAQELESLSAHDVRPDEGGVHFAGTLETLYRVNLRSRLVTRVLLRLGSFRALSWPELFNKCKKLPWGSYLTADAVVGVQASCHRSRLMHSGRAAAVAGDAVVAAVGCRMAGEGSSPSQQIHLRFDQDLCEVSIDSSGERLDRRGYRLQPGRAPVRETLAAGVLAWLAWQPDEPLMVPMCGSGTFAIEAALQARRTAPNLERAFPFVEWPLCKAKGWQRAYDKAVQLKGYTGGLRIMASDIDAEVVAAAAANAERAGVDDAVRIEQRDFFALQGEMAAGVMVCNPPFGIRIGGDTLDFYGRLGEHLRSHFHGWRVAIFCPDRRCETALGMAAAGTLRIRHGGRWMNVLRLEP